MSSASTSTYKFGDSERAAERLGILAQVFEPSTREFLQQLIARNPRAILDLGCGPGFTTRLLAEVFPQATVLGLDSSPAFVELARRPESPRVAFCVGDVARALPGSDYDLIYCRYLVTHLPQAREAVERWGSCLTPTGAIVIEENEWIHTAQPAFARYLEIVEAMLAAGGQRLYVGAELASDVAWSSLRVALSEVVPIAVAEGAAAAMFALNIATWKSQPFIIEHYASEEIAALERNLTCLAEVNSSERSIAFGRRRLVLERAST